MRSKGSSFLSASSPAFPRKSSTHSQPLIIVDTLLVRIYNPTSVQYSRYSLHVFKTPRQRPSRKDLCDSIILSPPKLTKASEPTFLSAQVNKYRKGKKDGFSLQHPLLTSFSRVFVQLYLKIMLPTTEALIRPSDRKTAVISFVETLCSSDAFAQKYKMKGWALTAEALLKLLENPLVPTTTDDIIVDQDVDDMSFGVGFTQLTTVKKPVRDQWPEITDVKSWVGQQLRKNGPKMSQYARERLSPQAQPMFAAYLQG